LGQRALLERQLVIRVKLDRKSVDELPRTGLVSVRLTALAEETGKPWEIHRYRTVDDPVLAESLLWDLLGYPRSNDRELINIDVRVAEQAFRDISPQVQRKIALAEMEKEDAQKTA